MKTGKNKIAVLGIILGVLLIASAAVAYSLTDSSDGEDIVWDVTLIGSNNEQMVLSYLDIRSMPHHESRGGFFTTVGVVNGPYDVEGVLLKDICELVGGITADDVVAIYAVDGYSMIFDLDQINGDIETYDVESIHEVPHDQLEILLIYKQDGKLLAHNDGRPLRLAVVGNANLLTEGHNWVKWVDKIEVIRLE